MTDTRTLAAMLLHLAGLMRQQRRMAATVHEHEGANGCVYAQFTIEDVEQMAADVQREPVPLAPAAMRKAVL